MKNQANTITPTYQTLTGKGTNESDPGDCLAACIASITGVALEDVPHFVADYVALEGSGVDAMDAAGWLQVLANATTWLDSVGFDTAELTHTADGAELFGAPVWLCLALVFSHLDETMPHIIVTDQRRVQVWNANPLDVTPYSPGDVLAAMAVWPRG